MFYSDHELNENQLILNHTSLELQNVANTGVSSEKNNEPFVFLPGAFSVHFIK